MFEDMLLICMYVCSKLLCMHISLHVTKMQWCMYSKQARIRLGHGHGHGIFILATHPEGT
jgi:hypothetical protein